MRNFSKTLISMAAVMAVGSAMAAGAMAVDATYADGVITLSGKYATGSSQTMLVVAGDEAAAPVGGENSNIKQIDQIDNVAEGEAAFSKITVGDLEDGTYTVRIGGSDGSINVETLTVSSGPTLSDKPIYIGDVNGDDKVNVSDYSFVLTYAKKRRADKDSSSTNYTANTMDPKKLPGDDVHYIGDVNGDDKVNVSDYSFVLTYAKKRRADKDSNSTNYTANTMDPLYYVVE